MSDEIHRFQTRSWESFAGDYDLMMGTLPDRGDLAAIAGMVKPEDSVLELGAGTGRISCPLSRRGHRVTAVDLSSTMLETLRAKDPEGLIEVVHADARSLDLGTRKFEAILCLFNTLTYATSQTAQREVLRSCKSYLAPHGFMLLESTSPIHLVREWGAGPKVVPTAISESMTGTMAGRLGFESQELTISHSFRGARAFQDQFTHQRFIWPSELRLMAELEGLRVSQLWGDWKSEPFNESSPYMIARLEHLDAQA